MNAGESMNRITHMTCLLLAGVLLAGYAFAQDSSNSGAASLGDIARAYRDHKQVEVQVNPEDAKVLFAAVDEISSFASQDSGFIKHAAIKRELVNREHVAKNMAKALNSDAVEEEVLRSELVLQKFGLLPPGFQLKEFLLKTKPMQLQGYYDPKDKTMYLMDWVDLEDQRPIMAHELTHALQDQNYDLTKFVFFHHDAQRAEAAPADDPDERSDVHRAVVEGQAMVVYLDYMAQEAGLSQGEFPEVRARALNHLDDYDPPIALHDAPRVLKEEALFPYREGMAFELELLQQSSRQQAFAGVFARPPKSTYEILNPDAYLKKATPPAFAIPDLSPVLGNRYQAYDSGTMGQLDVRIMVREFGREHDVYWITSNWDGGAYVAVKATGAEAQGKEGTAGLALLYASRWKTAEAARRFAELYQNALAKRVNVRQQDEMNVDCVGKEGCQAPLWAVRLLTSEGPTFLEIWPGNLLIITHSFDEGTVAQLRPIVLAAARSTAPAGAANRELGAKLGNCASFLAFQEQVRRQLAKVIAEAAQ
jgi:hypothetical protein